MRYHLTPMRMAITKKIRDNNVVEDMEKSEPSCTIGGNVNWYSHYGKDYAGTS